VDVEKSCFIAFGPESKKCVIESAKAGCLDTQSHLIAGVHSSSPSSLDSANACKHTSLTLPTLHAPSKPC
jgi:hypothetical protein